MHLSKTLFSSLRRRSGVAALGVAASALALTGCATSGSPSSASSSGPAASDSCEVVATDLFDALLAGESTPEELAERFTEDVDWFIPGNTELVPWIGERNGRAEVANFYTELGQQTTLEMFEIDTIIGEGDRCVVLGNLRTRANDTGRYMVTDFAYDIAVEDGLINRYHMHEDSWAVSEALAPAR